MCLTLVSGPTINWVHDHSQVRSVYGNMADQRIRAYAPHCLKRLCCCKSITYRVILVLSQTGADHFFFKPLVLNGSCSTLWQPMESEDI